MSKDQENIFMGEWSPDEWINYEKIHLNKLNLPSRKNKGIDVAIKYSRKVLKTHSTSFFIVTRFLPKYMRDEVELVYGSVRYPDEIVDSFDISPQEKRDLLGSWKEYYKISLTTSSFAESIDKGVPVLLAGFSETIKKYQIPTEYYLSFLEAMELDVEPRKFKNIDEKSANKVAPNPSNTCQIRLGAGSNTCGTDIPVVITSHRKNIHAPNKTGITILRDNSINLFFVFKADS